MKAQAVGLAVVIGLLGRSGESLAQEPRDRAVEPVVATTRPSRLDLGAILWTEPPPRRLGVFVLETPRSPGEMLRVRVPVGELMSKAAHGVRAANQRRREAAARRDVQRALAAFTNPTTHVPF